MLSEHTDFRNIRANDIMNILPKSIQHNQLAVKALSTMQEFSITQLIVLDNDKYVGIIHLHDLIKEGLV